MGAEAPLPAPAPFFLPIGTGQRLCVYHRPAQPGAVARAAVVYVHPLGDEMNKSRHQAAMAARALAQAGCAVLQIDLLGCGDSSGRFEDANWAAWQEDVRAAVDWLAQRYPEAPLWLWGLRAGCLLAAQVAADLAPLKGLLLWQPAVSGRAVLQQWLRLASAGALLSGETAQQTSSQLRAALAQGQGVDVGGYSLSASLAQSMAAANLAAPEPTSEVHWLEVSSRATAPLLATSVPVIKAWRNAGLVVQAQVVAGPPFWQTTELQTAPDLVASSLAAVCGPGSLAA